MDRPYFDALATDYDRLWGVQDDEIEELAFLCGHAGGGPVLDVGVGTGRIALPLAESGLSVHGIDNSPNMLAQFMDKASQRELLSHVTGQLSDLRLKDVLGKFSLVFAVYHTLYYAHSRVEQAEFFHAARRLLTPDGKLVVEGYHVTEKRLGRWQAGVHPVAFDEDGLQVEFYDHQPDRRLVRTGRLIVCDGSSRYSYQVDRYLWPDEMDAMAQAAGLQLLSRTAGWMDEPFSSAKSGRSVALYGAAEST